MKMLEGLWTVEVGLRETEMHDAGVAIFQNQRILGGSGSYFHTGKYEVKRSMVQGEVQVNFWGRKRSPIWGSLTKFQVRFSGKVQRSVMLLDTYVVEDTKKGIFLRLTKRAELS